MSDLPLLFDHRGPVVTLTLNRPDSGNAIDIPLADALLDAALKCEADPAIRCVLLTGQGRMFCTGGDVKAFANAGPQASVLISRLTASLHMAIARFARMEKPLVIAVNGAAAGAGLGLAIMGDAVFAARSAQFALAYGALGLSPDAGATWLLPRLIGLRQAQRLALLGERIGSDEAERIGLITRSVDDADLMATAQVLADRLSRSAVGAWQRTRELLLTSLNAGFETQLEREAQSIAAAASGAEGQEGIAAFVGKRKADFLTPGGK